MIKQLKISFAGSFQARFATDSDAPGDSPTDPYGDYGTKGKGWTFAYKEKKFDRVIRLSGPVELRSALVDAWKDVVVTGVEADKGKGLASLPTDQLMSKAVSFGPAIFDTAAGGGGVSFEALVGFKLSIGASIFQADPDPVPVLDGVKGANSAWETEYKTKKPGLIAVSGLDPVRAKVLKDTYYETYAGFFQLRCPSKTSKLKGVTFKGPKGVLVDLDPPAATKYKWTIDLAFYRWDGDTLTGQTDGTVTATHV